MKQIKKELTLKLQDTNENNIINFISRPENLLFNSIIYNNITNYNSGKLQLNKQQDTTTIYTITFNSQIVFIESTGLVNIYLNDSTTPITTRSFTYDNPNQDIKICISLPDIPPPLTDNYQLDDDITVQYVTGTYEEIYY